MDTPELATTAPAEADPGLPAAARELIARGRRERLKFDVAGFEEAVPLLREAIELEPAEAPAYAELSLTYSSWGLCREASCLGFRRELRALEFQSLYDLAYAYAETALRLAPERAAPHRAMAAALRRGTRIDPERRQREALLAVELDPEDPEGLAERWRVLGYDPDDAVIRRVAADAPDLLAVQLDLAAAFAERGRYAEALTRLENALRSHPASVFVYHDIALLLDRMGLRAKALEILGKARRFRAEDPMIKQAYALLGEAV